MEKRRRAWVYVALWMAVIFLFSAQPSDESSAQSGRIVALILWFVRLLFGEHAAEIVAGSGIEFVVRKLAHFSEYALLAVLLCRAFRLNGVQAEYPMSLLVCALYACTDEFHQFFVPGRSMELRDVLVDTSGGAFGLCMVLGVRVIRTLGRKRTGVGT